MTEDRTPYFDELPEVAIRLFNSLCGLVVLHDDDERFKKLHGLTFDYPECRSPIEVIFRSVFDMYLIATKKDVNLIQQYEVKTDDDTRYILDFAYIGEHLKLAIECDGHEFHERTKEQVNYGNKRNYDLQMLGFEVLHFSGSEIYNDPLECVKKTVAYIEKKEEEADGDL